MTKKLFVPVKARRAYLGERTTDIEIFDKDGNMILLRLNEETEGILVKALLSTVSVYQEGSPKNPVRLVSSNAQGIVFPDGLLGIEFHLSQLEEAIHVAFPPAVVGALRTILNTFEEALRQQH